MLMTATYRIRSGAEVNTKVLPEYLFRQIARPGEKTKE